MEEEEEEETIKKSIEFFCDKSGIPHPLYPDSTQKILARMRAVGLVNDTEVEIYMKKVNDDMKKRIE